MASLKIVAVLLFAVFSKINCSVFAPSALAAPVLTHHAHATALAPAPSLLRYTNVAPPSVLPFSAQVSTFSRHLHVFDAPYAAGVLPGSPAIVQRTVVPGVPHAHFLSTPSVVPAPHFHSAFPAPHLHSAALPAPHLHSALATSHLHAALPAPHLHSALSAPHLHAALPAAHVHPVLARAAPVAPHLHALPALHAHSYAGPHLHAAVARSVHGVAPGVLPATAIADNPLLG